MIISRSRCCDQIQNTFNPSNCPNPPTMSGAEDGKEMGLPLYHEGLEKVGSWKDETGLVVVDKFSVLKAR